MKLLMGAEEAEIELLGVVRTCHPGVGMGVAFTKCSREDQERLHSLIQALTSAPD